jgi:hypothetical protein
LNDRFEWYHVSVAVFFAKVRDQTDRGERYHPTGALFIGEDNSTCAGGMVGDDTSVGRA